MPAASTSAKTSKQAGKRQKKPYQKPTESETKLPGVQKLKSSIRQTRRLLAKDNLAADVRVQTERRLNSLEKDLLQAENASKERDFAVRYHKIKFFERQKVVRKITQAKKAKTNLDELRLDLNYILHFPKTKKYISLFPPTSDAPSTPATDAERTELREWIRTSMENGELSQEPELTLSEHGLGHQSSKTTSKQWDKGRPKSETKKGHPPVDALHEGEEQDEFFGDDDED